MSSCSRFDLRQLATGRGDHWVAGGALAIGGVAAAELVRAIEELGALSGLHDPLEAVDLAFWVAAMAWLPALVLAELRWPRLGFDVRRWSTVFPVGMYATESFTVARAESEPWIAAFGHVWVWVALAVWAVVLVASAVHGVKLLRAPR